MKIRGSGTLTYSGSSLKINSVDLLDAIAKELGAKEDEYGYKFGRLIGDITIEITEMNTFCILSIGSRDINIGLEKKE